MSNFNAAHNAARTFHPLYLYNYPRNILKRLRRDPGTSESYILLLEELINVNYKS